MSHSDVRPFRYPSRSHGRCTQIMSTLCRFMTEMLPRLNVITCQLVMQIPNYANAFNGIHCGQFTIISTYKNMFRSAFGQYLADDCVFIEKNEQTFTLIPFLFHPQGVEQKTIHSAWIKSQYSSYYSFCFLCQPLKE